MDGETKDEQKKTGVGITDNRAKKQWLKKYQAATREIEDLIRERAVWRERGETITQVISEMPHGGGTSDKTGEAAARIAAIDEQILQRIGELAKFRSDIECVISGTGDDTAMDELKNAPCLGCEKRTLGCHGRCEDYLAFSAARRAYNDKRRLLADAENAARTMAFEGERRIEKRRRNK